MYGSSLLQSLQRADSHVAWPPKVVASFEDPHANTPSSTVAPGEPLQETGGP